MQSRVRNDSGSQPSQQMGAAELGSSSQRCVCAVPRQKWHWLTAISTDGSCRTRFELSEMCLCSPEMPRFELAPEMALAHSHLNRWERLGSSSQRCQQMGAAELGSSSQRCVCAVPRQKWHWLTAISTDGSCRTRFELSEMCLCSPAPEMALAHSHLNRWELPN